MKCIIPGANVKVFGRAIHSLSKIGEELYIEALEYGLALRTVNSSRSAYACFIFAPTFFTHYSDGVDDVASDVSEEEVLKYKINMKSCLTVFKSLSTLEKTVDKCKIKLDLKESRLVFQMYCRHGIVKTHNLAFIECETLQAVFSKDTCKNILTAQTKLLCEAVLNFQTTQEEISLILDASKTRLKNYVDDETDPNKVVHTELSLEPDEFESYTIGEDCQVTFCLKELRAILAFSEPANLPVSIYFDAAGKPIVFCMDTDPSFEANFVLATLADKNSTVSSSQCTSQQQSSQRITDTTHRFSENSVSRKAPRPEKQQKEETRQKRANVTNGDQSSLHSERNVSGMNKRSPSSRIDAACKELCSDNIGNGDDSVLSKENNQKTAHEKNGMKSNKPLQNYQSDSRTSEDANRQSWAATSETSGNITLDAPERPRPSFFSGVDEEDDDDDVMCSPVIPIQTSRLKENTRSVSQIVVPDDDETTDEEGNTNELVPGTPPSKKFKSMFFGLSQSTVGGTQSQQKMVLAADTDDEDE